MKPPQQPISSKSSFSQAEERRETFLRIYSSAICGLCSQFEVRDSEIADLRNCYRHERRKGETETDFEQRIEIDLC